MSNSLQDRIAAAISEIGAHILQHGRDMYGETAALADAQQVLRDCAAALKKAAAPPPGETVIPAETVKAAGAAGAKGRAGSA